MYMFHLQEIKNIQTNTIQSSGNFISKYVKMFLS